MIRPLGKPVLLQAEARPGFEGVAICAGIDSAPRGARYWASPLWRIVRVVEQGPDVTAALASLPARRGRAAVCLDSWDVVVLAPSGAVLQDRKGEDRAARAASKAAAQAERAARKSAALLPSMPSDVPPTPNP